MGAGSTRAVIEELDSMQHEGTRTAMDFAGLSSYETWMHYCNMGGDTDYFEFDAYLHGLHPLEADDADTVSQAVNELIDDSCPEEAHHCRAPYSWRAPVEASSGTEDEVDAAPAHNPSHPPLVRFATPHASRTFASRLLSGVDLGPLTGLSGVPLPPGAPAELISEILDGGRPGRTARNRRQ